MQKEEKQKGNEELRKEKRAWLNVHEDDSFINMQDYKDLYPEIFGDVKFN